MKTVYFITHPEVNANPNISHTNWNLSPDGVARVKNLAALPFWKEVQYIFTSTEVKAIETGALLSQYLDIPVRSFPDFHENDRSATGYLSPEEFREAVYQFFSNPRESYRGWESATDAQKRVTWALERLMEEYPDLETVAIIGHGATGTLLRCSIGGLPVDRMHCQKQVGAILQFDVEHKSVVSDDWMYY